MPDAHPVRTAIVGTTVGGLLVALFLWAAGFVGVVWRGLWSAASWLGHQFAASISVPTWLVLGASGYAVAVTVLLRRRRPPPSRPNVEQAAGLREGDPHVLPRKLNRPHVTGMRAM